MTEEKLKNEDLTKLAKETKFYSAWGFNFVSYEMKLFLFEIQEGLNVENELNKMLSPLSVVSWEEVTKDCCASNLDTWSVLVTGFEDQEKGNNELVFHVLANTAAEALVKVEQSIKDLGLRKSKATKFWHEQITEPLKKLASGDGLTELNLLEREPRVFTPAQLLK